MVNNERGQSAVEFILTFAFGLGITFLFVNQALNITSGFVAHYVNFMASRAYLVHETGNENVENVINLSVRKAREVFQSYGLSKVGVDAKFDVFTRDKTNALFTGSVLQFEKKMSAMPFVGGTGDTLFYSESFLGKEPSRVTCAKMICAAISGSQDACKAKQSSNIVLYDNGC